MGECITGRHNYEHLGFSCAEVDEQFREAREIALRTGTSIVSEKGPTVVWDEDGNPKPGDGLIPDGIDASGAGVYASGAIGPAHCDDAEDA